MKYAGPKSRVFAKFIDLMVVLFLGMLLRGGAGSILGFVYSLVADGLPFKKMKGQSIGKKIMGLQVISEDGVKSDLKASIIRNIPIGFVTFLMIIPFWGWILGFLVGIPLWLIEISLIARADRRQRLGDVMAETVVTERA